VPQEQQLTRTEKQQLTDWNHVNFKNCIATPYSSVSLALAIYKQ